MDFDPVHVPELVEQLQLPVTVVPSFPNVPSTLSGGSLERVIRNWRFEIGHGLPDIEVILPDTSVVPPHFKPENVYVIWVMPSPLGLTMKSSANPVVEPCQEEAAFALTMRVTTTVWDVAPVALIVIVPLYVPAARPDVL